MWVSASKVDLFFPPHKYALLTTHQAPSAPDEGVDTEPVTPSSSSAAAAAAAAARDGCVRVCYMHIYGSARVCIHVC
jgi:hypothetical protein